MQEAIYEWGNPIANKDGVNVLMSKLRSKISPSVVQGNYDDDQYRNDMTHTRVEFTDAIVLKNEDWEIAEDNVDIIINMIMGLIEPYMTRLINAGDRQSYIPQMKTTEHHIVGGAEGRKGEVTI